MSNNSRSLSPELSEKLHDLKKVRLSTLSDKVIQRGGKTQRQESFKHALVELNQSFEDYLSQAITLRFQLHPGQAKKVRFKKDRIRILKQHGIDYLQIDGAETAQVLLLITQSIVFEDAVVTPDLNDVFPFWKEGYPMVQFDNTYTILAEDIQLHFEALIDTLLAH
ncbi:MAG: hypothetical protein LKF82_13945 [Acinetobacter populi]|jgi:NACalpha-BTF3-like transcription factor|uniref:hypothetical protein n=1 Tax=Acinetobacter populi TaxID=1582270 RepID=UPI0023578FE7|nr:hypothetical protein [Acinetobacter populi]MCH4248907.1 hypothetical protein [Acinetobacter populi]